MTTSKQVQKIFQLALEITQSKKAHVFVDYSGHVDLLCVSANHINTDYQDPEREKILDHRLYLDSKSAGADLQEIILELEELKQEYVLDFAI